MVVANGFTLIDFDVFRSTRVIVVKFNIRPRHTIES